MITSNKKESAESKTTEPKSRLFSAVNTSEMAQTAANFINKAVGVLEEEIAVGILAAQKVEKRFVDVEKVRSQDPAALLSRFRKDAHEVIDMMLDMITVTTHQLSDIAQKVTGAGTDSTENTTDSPDSSPKLPVLQPDTVVSPGDKFSIPITLENEHNEQEMVVSFDAVNLIDQKHGSIIDAKNMKFEPAALHIPPKSRGQVTIHVNIPKSAKTGSYSGIISDKILQGLSAVILVNIVESAKTNNG